MKKRVNSRRWSWGVSCLLSLCLLTGCSDMSLVETMLFPNAEPPVKEIAATFTVEGVTFPTNPQTYEDIVDMIEIMVENDIMSIEVPYRGDFMSAELYPSYEFAYGTAYKQVNTTHMEHTSNTSTYVIGYRVEADGGHIIYLHRSDKAYTNEEILAQNQFFREEVAKLVAGLQGEGRIQDDMEDREKLEVLYQFVAEYLRYSSEITDLSYTAYGAVFQRDVVCQGYVSLFNAMAQLMGFEAEGVSGTVGLGSTNVEDGHIWSRVKVGEEWIYCDPTFGDRYSYSVDEGGKSYNMEYFDMSEDSMNRDRSTNRYGVNNAVLLP